MVSSLLIDFLIDGRRDVISLSLSGRARRRSTTRRAQRLPNAGCVL